MTEYTVSEAAEILQVTSRALRHWDGLGLLSPSARSSADYRLYSEKDLARGLDILVYRAAGVPLRDISAVLDAAPRDRRAKVMDQKRALQRQLGQLRNMIAAANHLLESEIETMSTRDMRAVFGENMPEFQQEARGKWGDTPEWEQGQQVQAGMSAADWRDVKEDMDKFSQRLADARGRGVVPGSDEAADIVEAHRQQIERWYETSREKQVILARMYVQDERYNETYGGNADYLLALVESQAQAEGIDISAVQWG